MGNVTAGMSIEEVEALGRSLQARAGELEAMARELDRSIRATDWTGADGERFKGDWWPHHRRRLDQIAEQIRGFGQSALNNASEQAQASGAASSAGSTGRRTGGGFDPGGILRGVSDTLSPIGTLSSVLGDVKDVRAFAAVGTGISYLGYVASGFTIGEDLERGDYGAAGLETLFTGGDVAADSMKSTGTPLGYAGGVATQAWTEVGREARNVDFSSKGWHDIQHATWGDWGGAIGYAGSQMPLKLVKIFGF